jgi:hypothetical protein
LLGFCTHPKAGGMFRCFLTIATERPRAE